MKNTDAPDLEVHDFSEPQPESWYRTANTLSFESNVVCERVGPYGSEYAGRTIFMEPPPPPEPPYGGRYAHADGFGVRRIRRRK